MKKIIKWFKSLFSTKFIAPVVIEKLSTAVDDKIARLKADALKEADVHKKILRDYVRTYFDKQYESSHDMEVAYHTINKEWKKHVRYINSTNKLINLSKLSFEKECERFIKIVKENKAKKELLNEA